MTRFELATLTLARRWNLTAPSSHSAEQSLSRRFVRPLRSVAVGPPPATYVQRVKPLPTGFGRRKMRLRTACASRLRRWSERQQPETDRADRTACQRRPGGCVRTSWSVRRSRACSSGSGRWAARLRRLHVIGGGSGSSRWTTTDESSGTAHSGRIVIRDVAPITLTIVVTDSNRVIVAGTAPCGARNVSCSKPSRGALLYVA